MGLLRFVTKLAMLGVAIGFAVVGYLFFVDPDLVTYEVTIRTALPVFSLVLPVLFVCAGAALLIVGLWDGVNRPSDAIFLVLGPLYGVLGLWLFNDTHGASTFLDGIFPDGMSILFLACLIGFCGFPPLYVAWKLQTESHYPGPRPASA